MARIPTFPQFAPAALAAFSTREFDAAKDLSAFFEVLGIAPDRFSTVNQVHGDKVIAASPETRGECGEADALVTNEKEWALVIRTADCIPLFILDPRVRAVGLAHVGWRGAKKGIVSRTLDTLRRRFGSKPANLRVAIGPAIRESCYEVGEEFKEYFPDFVREVGGKRLFDLAGAVKQELHQAGVPEDSVNDCQICTACSVNRFFSARREGQDTGRFLSLIMLK